MPLIDQPPPYQLPDPAENPQWYGEIWLKFPLAPTRLPIYLGHLFKAKCQLAVTINEMAQEKASNTWTLEKADHFHQRLIAWHSNLPEILQPRYIVHPGHMQLQ